MIDDLLKNETFLRWFPAAAGLVFVSAFVSLGLWQLDRAAEKKAMFAQFESEDSYAEPTDWSSLNDFDRLKVEGRYRGDRQVLIDNIPLEGRLGYYVITPFEPARSGEMLLVNRGWLPKSAIADDTVDLAIDSDYRTIRGLAGRLPRVAIRPGDAFVERGDWPRVALYPTIEEIGAEFGRDLLPSVLLLHQDASEGFVRHWRPTVSGPATHYSYAFQWFAMAAAAVCIAGWQVRKRLRRERDAG